MEREVILALHNRVMDRKEMDCEIEIIKKMFPYIESFAAFSGNNEVFDLSRHKMIKRTGKLMQIYNSGTQRRASWFVISKN